jgi:hypothetical protein
MVVFIAVADDVSETRNPSIVQDVHLFSIARKVRVMGSHLIIPLVDVSCLHETTTRFY